MPRNFKRLNSCYGSNNNNNNNNNTNNSSNNSNTFNKNKCRPVKPKGVLNPTGSNTSTAIRCAARIQRGLSRPFVPVSFTPILPSPSSEGSDSDSSDSDFVFNSLSLRRAVIQWAININNAESIYGPIQTW